MEEEKGKKEKRKKEGDVTPTVYPSASHTEVQ
jgi:hypothetical protein